MQLLKFDEINHSGSEQSKKLNLAGLNLNQRADRNMFWGTLLPQPIWWGIYSAFTTVNYRYFDNKPLGSPLLLLRGYSAMRCNLTSLEGSPLIVNGDYNIANNNITNFIGGPIYVGSSVFCNNMNIDSFDGFPFYVGDIVWAYGVTYKGRPISRDELEGILEDKGCYIRNGVRI